MKKAAVLGHYGFGKVCLNGQTIKTKILTQELERRFGEMEIVKTDTSGGAKALLKAPFQVFSALKQAENVLMLPAHNGLRVYGPLLHLARRFFPGRKLHYVIIGGWLPGFLDSRPGLKRHLQKFDGIYAETHTMAKALESRGFSNVKVMPNFKSLAPLKEPVCPEEPYRLCTFSRVMEEKGIAEAVRAVEQVNARIGRTVFILTVYGQVEPGQEAWFAALQAGFPDFVRYGGQVPFDGSTRVLQDCYALLFPTKFYTEGVPGTLIDAYAAGVPVICSRWESFSDVVEEGKVGLGYDFEDPEGLQKVLLACAQDPQRLLRMRPACLKKAREFLPEQAVSVLADAL